ncbi:MAG: histone deacetylase [Planctomycetaceae bacterium]|nr:histone deacetylase [Planctomycetaceae bacterium]
MVLLYSDDRFLRHETGQHPECPERLRRVYAGLRRSELWSAVKHVPVKTADAADVRHVHTPQYLSTLKSFAEAGGGRIEADTEVCAESFAIAMDAAGCAVDAVDRVLRGESDRALCLVRPPGHHALPDGAMGFCLLSNIAIAARTAVQRFGLNRVLIVDWDVHHGNGTQDVFYEDEHVTFFSAHRSPFYPGTGRKWETGRGAGLGSTFNLPLKFGVSRADYFTAFESVLTAAAAQCRPELVLISAGFDAHAEDPIGSLRLETEDFETLTKLVLQVAATHAQGRVVSLLEGGYNVDRLADCSELHLQTLVSD